MSSRRRRAEEDEGVIEVAPDPGIDENSFAVSIQFPDSYDQEKIDNVLQAAMLMLTG
jgi:hypothetical protein